MTAGRQRPDGGATKVANRQHTTQVAHDLLVELRSPTINIKRHAEIRDLLVGMHLPLARHLARRFNHRGETLDDLEQVANVGLLKAILGFDPDRRADFASYAVPTMLGELKRHFRDKGWSVQVPRRLKELKLDVTRANDMLTQGLGRVPTVHDLASHLGVEAADIRECQISSRAYSTLSLSEPVGTEDPETRLADVLGDLDPGMEFVEDRETLRPLIEELPPRERRIIAMRFYDNMTQTQIATDIGISQMHVSRLLSRSLAHLREGILTGTRALSTAGSGS